ncbi:MAG: DNA methyltransferase [Candidatus Poribacteria bacterium]
MESIGYLIEPSVITSESYIETIDDLDSELTEYFQHVIKVDHRLNRKLVSFQANKDRSAYRWYKFKEAFSADLVEYLLYKYSIPKGRILDPFAGSGTALFAAADLGYDADGIEILPIAQQIIECRRFAAFEISDTEKDILKLWRDSKPWKHVKTMKLLNELRITEGAYPKETAEEIGKFLIWLEQENGRIVNLLRFALFCVLESVSYTRKDGQFLRWDHRSGRGENNTFSKGKILSFDEAITQKLNEVITDIENSNDRLNDLLKNIEGVEKGDIQLNNNSCLEILTKLNSNLYNAVITSPPYCNRYDYTRTYALENALMGMTEEQQIDLRQRMLSCTVESRTKELTAFNSSWTKAISICDTHSLLQQIIEYLEYQKKEGKLNNNGIPRMVKGYFYEMACVIQECWHCKK